MKNIVILAAVHPRTSAIGNKNKLVFNIPEDMANFKSVTMGMQVVVGRKTWDSIPNGLPGRDVFVVTRDADSVKPADNVTVCRNILDVLAKMDSVRPMFVIGGEEIYRQFIPHATHMLLTLIHRPVGDFDTTFPPYNLVEWEHKKASPLTEEKDVVVHWLTRNE